MNTTAPTTHPPQQATHERGPMTRQPDRSAASRPPTWSEAIAGFAPLVFAPAFFGPPVIFVLGPWLLLVLLLIPPVALLMTLVLVFLVAAGVLVALLALLASPFLLVSHVRSRHPASRRRFAFVRRPGGAAPAVIDPAPHPSRSGWLPAPAAGGSSPQASFAPSLHGQHISARN